VDFTREPVIETIITPREGCKIVIRSSKGMNQEEYFLDAVEVVSFGHALFFRSLEKPKSFLLPISDYELLEVRETKMVLKHGVGGKSIKIGGGKETILKPAKSSSSREENREESREDGDETESAKSDKKRERRRRPRRRGKGGDEENAGAEDSSDEPSEKVRAPKSHEGETKASAPTTPKEVGPMKLFPAPTTLISDTIQRYRKDESFKEAFYGTDEEKPAQQAAPEENKENDPTLPTVLPEAEDLFPVETGSLWDFADALDNSDQEPK
jgi:hypothetical protein